MEVDFREILDSYQGRVYNQAFRMLGSHEDAEEATQDVFLRIHRSLTDFRGDSKLSTWIYRITANVCINRMRKTRMDTIGLDEPFDVDGRTAIEFIADESHNPEIQRESEEMAELVRTQVRRLPPKWAMALSLHHFDDLSYDEIAEAMKIPRATVATYIFRARKQLAHQIITIMGKEPYRGKSG